MGSSHSSYEYRIGESAQERGLPYVPDCYHICPEQRPALSSSHVQMANVPLFDLGGLRGTPEQRATLIKDIGNACWKKGFFQHLASSRELPMEEKMKHMSNDVHKPVRYGTSLKDGVDRTQYWRVFLKHYAHPLEDWIHLWPQNPPAYREKMGKYSSQVRKVAMELAQVLSESLGIDPTHLTPRMDGGMQVITANSYPPCPNPELALGLPPHSDYSCLTIVLQNSPGLQILDPEDGTWKLVPTTKGALQIHVGDHLEVLSNGLYRSVLHRAVLNRDTTRISIASFHSLGMDEKMEPAPELLSQQNPRGYRGSSFRDFLDFLSANDLSEGKSFVDTLRIKN